jgi:hypothetical protein
MVADKPVLDEISRVPAGGYLVGGQVFFKTPCFEDFGNQILNIEIGADHPFK